MFTEFKTDSHRSMVLMVISFALVFHIACETVNEPASSQPASFKESAQPILSPDSLAKASALLADGIALAVDEPVMTKTEYGDRVEIAEMPSTARAGQPRIPTRTLRVLIPYGQHLDSVRVSTGERVELPGTYRLEAAQMPIPPSQEDARDEPGPDRAVYESDEPFPEVPYEILGEQSFRGYRIAMINLFPVEYRPRSGRLAYFTSMQLHVTTKPDAKVNDWKIRPRSLTADRDALSDRADDLRALSTYPSADAKGNTLLETWEYVIITSDGLAPSFQVLADHKITKGLTAAVITTEDIYADYDGTRPDGSSDNQTRIRNFIIDAFQNHGTRYVLLGGDSDRTAAGGEAGAPIVPHRSLYAEVGNTTDSDIPADIYYACLDGSFDNDADGIYGESTDGPAGGEVDLTAEVFVGRAPVDSLDEAESFVQKTIRYETAKVRSLRQVQLVGELLWTNPLTYGGPYKEETRDGSTTGGYTTVGFSENELLQINTLYDQDGTWTGSQLAELLNSGAHLVNHIGHSNVTSNMRLSNGQVDALTNRDPYILYSQGCYCGSFDNRGTSGNTSQDDSIAEHHLGQDHGAVAVLMNSRYGWFVPGSTLGPSQYLDREFWDAVFGEDTLSLGEANQDSKEDNLGRINQAGIRWCIYEMNLLGDPETSVKVAPGDIPSPVALYSFEGNALDHSGNDFHGHIVGAGFVPDRNGAPNAALHFDGINDYVYVHSEPAFNLYENTLIAVIRLDDNDQRNWIINKGEGYGNFSMYVFEDSHTYRPGYAAYAHQTLRGNFSAMVSRQPLPLDEFACLAVSTDTKGVTTYYNGERMYSFTGGGDRRFNASDMLIGAGLISGNWGYLSGVIDDIQLWNGALSSDDIAELCSL